MLDAWALVSSGPCMQGGSGGRHAEEASAQLRRAVQEGDLAGMRAALAAGAQVNRAGEHLLALAVNSGQAEAVQARHSVQGWQAGLALGHWVRLSMQGGAQAASQIAPLGKHAALHACCCLQVLLEHGASLESRDTRLWTPLLHAVNRPDRKEEFVRPLLAAGADPSRQDKRGYSPLHYAASAGEVEIVKALAAAGADMGARTVKEEYTPLTLAVKAGSLGCVEALLGSGALVSGDALQAAAKRGCGEVLRLVLAAGGAGIIPQDGPVTRPDGSLPSWGQLALQAAASSGKTAAIEILLGAGAAVDGYVLVAAAGNARAEPLRLLLQAPGACEAARGCAGRLLAAAAHESAAAGNFALLLSSGLDVNRPDSDGRAALHHAAADASLPTLRALVAAGADANALDEERHTALHLAVESFWWNSSKKEEAVKLLLRAGTDVGALDGGENSVSSALESCPGFWMHI